MTTLIEAATFIELIRTTSSTSRRTLEQRSGHNRETLKNGLSGRSTSYTAIADMLDVFGYTLTITKKEPKNGKERP